MIHDLEAGGNASSQGAWESAGAVANPPDTPGTPASILTFTPPTDAAWMEQIPNTRENPMRREVAELLRALRQIHLSPNKALARRQIAAVNFGRRGWNEASLRRKYELYVGGGCKRRCVPSACTCPENQRFSPGDAWCLVDQARAPRQESERVPYATVQFFMACAESNQRNDLAGHREFLRVWREGRAQGRAFRQVGTATTELKDFPGYHGWPEPAWHGKHPEGCSYDNLRAQARRLGADNYTKTLARIGRQAASQHRLKVFTTRVGLPFAAQYQFDDHEFNVKIRWPDQQRFLRPRGFFVYERLSGSVFAQFVKPTLWDADLSKKEALKLSDFRHAVCAVLMGQGYRNDPTGTQFVWEHGTANDDTLAEVIERVTRGRVAIVRSGRFGRRAHDGQYDPSTPGHGRGNFRRKAGLESYFNLLDNAHALLAGQTGLNRDRSPEQLAGAEREALALVRLAQTLPPEQAAQLVHPLLSWPEFAAASAELARAIDTRRDHELEGWESCGFTEVRYLVGGEWMSEGDLQHLDPDRRAIILGRAREDSRLSNVLRLSPREVWTRHATELTRLDWRHLPDLLGGEAGAHRNPQHPDGTYAVRAGQFEIEDSAIGSDTLRFDAINLDGRRLFNGERYLCYLNPFLPTTLVVCDAQNRVVGLCPAVAAPSALDAAGIARRMGQVARWETEARTDLNARHAAEAAHIAAVREHNAEVREQSATGLTKAQRQTVADLQAPDPDAWARRQARLSRQAEQAGKLSQEP